MAKKNARQETARAEKARLLKKDNWSLQSLAQVSTSMLTWYDEESRDLPWRVKGETVADPYHVWLSEVMLQQTTVAAVTDYFHRFTEKWPTVKDLADAPNEEVMTAWAGLGYYARARNLHKCAIVIRDDYQGKFPSFEADLLKLPGIGAYTAAAIAAIAFGRRAVVVDGNIERVMSRLFRMEIPFPSGKDVIWHLTDAVTPDERAGDFAQSLMDLGASHCSPKNPSCMLCPLQSLCQGKDIAATLPKKAPKSAKPVRSARLLAIRRPDGCYFMQKRPESGLLGGMFEFPGTDWSKKGSHEDQALPDFGNPDLDDLLVGPLQEIAQIQHIFTHFQFDIRFLHLNITEEIADDLSSKHDIKWVHPENFAVNPLPSVMKKLADCLQAL